MSNAETFVNVLSELHSDRVIDCLEINDHYRLLVYEGDDSRSYIKPTAIDETESLDGLLIKNDQKYPIYLLAVDACFFHSDDQKRCDCLVFEDSCLCFVELKLKVHRRTQATDKLNDARRQLGASIQFFKTNVISKMPTKSFYRLEAYAVMRDHVYPRNRATRNNVFVRFLEQHGVELFETNTKIFSV